MPEASSTHERLLDPDQVDRIVRRAIDLDACRGSDPTDGLTVDTLAAAAADAGVDPSAVREAAALERLGPEPVVRRLDAVGGPGAIAVEATLDRPAADTLAALDEWLTRGHHLRRDYDGDGDHVWRKRPDLAATVQRVARAITGDAALRSQACIRAAVEPVDDHRCTIRILVPRSGARAATIGVAGTVGATSVAAGAVAATVVPPLVVVTAPGLAVATGVSVVARRHVRHVERELLRLVEQLRTAEAPRPIGHSMARRLRPRSR